MKRQCKELKMHFPYCSVVNIKQEVAPLVLMKIINYLTPFINKSADKIEVSTILFILGSYYKMLNSLTRI